uniref:Ig-like domain-containing protein n=1 Tax=Canis lupus familiaris TaxID=9615 RepID=A0A8C0P0M7_CANLF
MKRIWDALLGLLWVHVCLVTGMKVEQSPSALSLQEGASSILKCNYSSAVNNVQWFRQNPGGGSLTRLFYIASGMKQSGRLNCTLNAKERFSTLHVAASQLEDSATYLCAVEAQCSLVICSLPPNRSWACSTSTSLGRAFAPTAACAFYNFSFLLQYFFPPNIRCISAVVSLTFLALFHPRKFFVGKNLYEGA